MKHYSQRMLHCHVKTSFKMPDLTRNHKHSNILCKHSSDTLKWRLLDSNEYLLKGICISDVH